MNNMLEIPIFLASDENYAPFLCLAIYSVLKNTSSFINFYILDGGISEKSKSLIKSSLCIFNNFSIRYINMTKYSLNRFSAIKHYSLNTYSRYFISDIVSDLDKVIYLDADIIVHGDIAELYNIDLENKALAACPENFYKGNGRYVKRYIKKDFNNISNYFNSGVMLLNNKKLVDKNYSKQFVDMTIKLYKKLHCPDQDIFNIIFENDYKVINHKFNYMPDFYNSYQKIMPVKELETLDKNAIIFHYTCRKPWKNLRARKSELFWEIANETMFNTIIKEIYENQKHIYLNFLKNFFGIKFIYKKEKHE